MLATSPDVVAIRRNFPQASHGKSEKKLKYFQRCENSQKAIRADLETAEQKSSTVQE
jgi:hypothetical protein